MTSDASRSAPVSSERPGVDRSHRRRGAPSPATKALLAEYQDAMRAELRQLLTELRPLPDPADAPVVFGADPPPEPLTLAQRSSRWDLAIKLGRELGAEIDPAPTRDQATPSGGEHPGPTRRRRIDYG
jgi:hypothetical protein